MQQVKTYLITGGKKVRRKEDIIINAVNSDKIHRDFMIKKRHTDKTKIMPKI